MQFLGKLLANSIINGYLIGINFSPVFIKLLFKEDVTFEDMLSILPEEDASKYKYLLDPNCDVEDLEIYFSLITNRKKGTEIEMIKDGKNVQVTKDNLKLYFELLPQFLIVDMYKEAVESFLRGFNSIVEMKHIQKWISSYQFWCITSGVKEVTPEIVLSYVVISGGD